ncbi:MAG TPA: hypothetical protein VGM91_05370 [Conexibacter sp.]|jgi:hypothetical protein
MAVLADENCVARSNRSMVSLHEYRPASDTIPGSSEKGLPWRRQVVELIEDLAIERLADHLTEHVRENRERARAEQDRLAEQERAAEKAETELRSRLADMTPDVRLEALREFVKQYGRHTERSHNLREYIVTLNASSHDAAEAATPPTTDDRDEESAGSTDERCEAAIES